MSLVCASRSDGVITLISDTRITSNGDVSSIKGGVQKFKLLSGNRVVAFTNNRDPANRALEALIRKEAVDGQLTKGELLEHFERATVHESFGENELPSFVVALANEFELYEITNGFSRPKDYCLQGDDGAIKLFEKALESGNPYMPKEPLPRGQTRYRLVRYMESDGIVLDAQTDKLTREMDAMNQVIADREVPSVGGLCLAVYSTGGRFSFQAAGIEGVIHDEPGGVPTIENAHLVTDWTMVDQTVGLLYEPSGLVLFESDGLHFPTGNTYSFKDVSEIHRYLGFQRGWPVYFIKSRMTRAQELWDAGAFMEGVSELQDALKKLEEIDPSEPYVLHAKTEIIKMRTFLFNEIYRNKP